MKSLIFSFFLFAFTFNIASADPVDHATWDAMLKKYVTAKGNVNYKAWQKDTTDLVAYLKTISDNPPQSSWTPKIGRAHV